MAVFAVTLAGLGGPGQAQDEPDELGEALAPHAWMSQQANWPCRYSAQVVQQRSLGARSLGSSGRLFQDCQRGLVWLVLQPLPGAQVYARGSNFLAFDRRGTPRVLDGLAERRVGALLQDLFIGDIAALHRDFAHERVVDDGGPAVRLTPRDERLAGRLNAIVVRGDATDTRIRVDTGDAGAPASLTLHLHGFGVPAGLTATPGAAACRDGLRGSAAERAAPGGTERGIDAGLVKAACDALLRPGRWLEKARNERG